MAFSETLSEFFDSDDFAIAAVYSAATVYGLFDHEFVVMQGIEGERPIFMCAEADVTGIAHGDTILINATTYTVIGLQPDGHGAITLILTE